MRVHALYLAEYQLIHLFAGDRHPGNSLASCGAPAKVKCQDGLPDLSCPSPSSETSMTTMTLESTTTETSQTTTDSTSSKTSGTTEPVTTTSSFCTVVYGDGSSCVQVPDNTCGFGSQVICPLGKARPARRYCYYILRYRLVRQSRSDSGMKVVRADLTDVALTLR